MKNRLALFGTCVLLVLGLAACTRSDVGSVKDAGSGTGAAANTATADQAVAGQAEDGGSAQTGEGASQNSGGSDEQAAAEDTAQQAAGQADVTADVVPNAGEGDGADAPAEQVDADNTYDALNQSGEGVVAASQTGADEMPSQEENWDGTFTDANGETLTLSVVDEFTISFAFAQSGISGAATVNEDEAVYYGDDGVIVTLENQGDRIEVSVANESGEEEPSVISGGYERQ